MAEPSYPKWEPKDPAAPREGRPALERIADDVAAIKIAVVFLACVVALGVVVGLIAAIS
jgi:hypothetical protein